MSNAVKWGCEKSESQKRKKDRWFVRAKAPSFVE